ncbi:3-beta hydroxysteroid dehydrogenase/isomerase family-domain-containing protein [Xylogone sp. PMI_703]|nr:3-beta hydroxysteroid dehydrogenase/isomerase family-domain-containing protein [Xylogone sp. PMI_703]
MAPVSTQRKDPLGNVLVIGGCGFLGHHIVNLLVESYTCNVSVVDLRTVHNRRPESDGVQYYDGDITDISSLLPIFEKAKPDVVIHTASPTLVGGTKQLYRKVNVEGTKCVIEACQKTDVKALVYTSSASVVSDNASDLINADERWPIIAPKNQTEYYSLTKAEAETLVIAANRSPKLLTAAIRPASIFGPGDVQLLPPILNVLKNNQTRYQLGENDNLFDFTYVVNVAHAHCLAARALLHTSTLSTAPLDYEKVDGEVFFITNDSPVYFWDFARMVWKAGGSDKGIDHVWHLPKDLMLAAGGAAEWVMWLIGRTPKLTRRQVKYSCMTRYYNISKAKTRLGYKPIVPLKEGIEKGVAWFVELEKKNTEKKGQ